MKPFFKEYILYTKPYDPSRIIDELYEERDDWIRLMANENPYPPPKELVEAIAREAYRINYYPQGYTLLKKMLAEYSGVDEDNLIIGAGSMEIIDSVLRGFIDPGDKVAVFTPAYTYYIARITVNGGRSLPIPLEKPWFSYNDDLVLETITSEKPKLAIIGYPSNPVGNMPSPKLVLEIADHVPIVLVDEAYYEFSRETLKDYALSRENIVVTRTMSKAFGLAGARIGYALSNKDIIDYLKRLVNPYGISRLSVVAAIKALEHLDYYKKTIDLIIAERDRVYSELKKYSELMVFPSKTNFLLIKIMLENVKNMHIVLNLLEHRVIVRPVQAYGLDEEDRFFRISIGRRQDNDLFLRVLPNIIYGLGSR
ncbi:MAG: histidinol-phosphate transaminase [Desulfurococcales archaeon]|nr:histidinol-phosphate transaminase [Desulfurococcales archaeon]